MDIGGVRYFRVGDDKLFEKIGPHSLFESDGRTFLRWRILKEKKVEL